MKKFIFLDIDGVIAGDEEWGVMLPDNSCPFNREALDNLELVVKADLKVKIIISSTWRKGQSLDELQRLFKIRGFKYWRNIAGKTAVLSFEKQGEKFVESNMPMPRGCEIEYYLRTNTDRIDQYKYVIFDDGSDMMYWQKDSFVHTRDHLLTLKDAQKAIEILG